MREDEILANRLASRNTRKNIIEEPNATVGGRPKNQPQYLREEQSANLKKSSPMKRICLH